MQGFTWYELWTRILPEWLTGLGTVGAVVTAVFMARRDNRLRLLVRAGVRILVTPGQPVHSPDYLMIEAVNLGRRQATVVNLGWEYGLPWARRHAVQQLNAPVPVNLAGRVPVTLGDGQSESYFIPLDQWLEANRDEMVRNELCWPWLACQFIRACVYTSTGAIFRCRIEPPLIKRMVRYQRSVGRGRVQP